MDNQNNLLHLVKVQNKVWILTSKFKLIYPNRT